MPSGARAGGSAAPRFDELPNRQARSPPRSTERPGTRCASTAVKPPSPRKRSSPSKLPRSAITASLGRLQPALRVAWSFLPLGRKRIAIRPRSPKDASIERGVTLPWARYVVSETRSRTLRRCRPRPAARNRALLTSSATVCPKAVTEIV